MRLFLLILGILYAISPYDLFPDFFVGMGWLDDLGVLALLWWYFFVYRKRRYGHQGAHYQRRQSFSAGQDEPRSGPRGERGGYGFGAQDHHKDPYTVLGVSQNASAEEVKKAYKRLANTYHPDKVFHLGKEFQDLAEKRFKEIQKAYQEIKSR